ncbi:uncharacterized protein LOC108671841 [Hyalella azteca]|uniref:Uncharacterized protein LOC108671841 n=1 Tax=Hyalella azteca TaxID=294128 RepID=A0A8B7NMM3_HYAAZ|nr:uncharacterized protein LOC108671841 [Hyalella azteca]
MFFSRALIPQAGGKVITKLSGFPDEKKKIQRPRPTVRRLQFDDVETASHASSESDWEPPGALSSDDASDREPVEPCSSTPRTSTGRRYLKWNEADTKIILDYFKKYFTEDGEGARGHLPGTVEMESFLKRHKLRTLMPFQHKRKIEFLRTKIYNTHKTCRMQARVFMNKYMGPNIPGGR